MPSLNAADIRRLCGDVTDATIAEIIAVGASAEDVEIALSWATGESDVMITERRPLEGTAAEVYDILASDPVFAEEDEAGASPD